MSGIGNVVNWSLDGLPNLQRAWAFEYSDHLWSATGIPVMDYRGKNAEKEIWKLAALLVRQVPDQADQGQRCLAAPWRSAGSPFTIQATSTMAATD
jgi:hypothetical protein